MVGWGDVYRVVVAMVPLYVALGLGYGSVKWWRMFKPDHCDAINRFSCCFIIPFFTFHFTASVNPYTMNFRFLAGDVIAKAMTAVALALWGIKGDFSWAVTSFSLSSFNNTLVVGVPLLKAMYGAAGEDIVAQSSVIQFLLWFPIHLFMLEFWRTTCSKDYDPGHQQEQQPQQLSSIEIVSVGADKHELQENQNNTTSSAVVNDGDAVNGSTTKSSLSFGSSTKNIGAKLGKNPNCYGCALGLIWALLARRWDFEMPSIVEESIHIMAKAGSGAAMFSMGLFMALQEKAIACDVQLTLYGMVLRFLGAPLAIAVGSLASGLPSNILHIAIIQAALPQAVTSYVFAQEYGLHANVLSTAVIFGTIVSLPILIAYYAILDLLY